MDFTTLYSFLERLQQNNSKEWMDANRKEYHSVRNSYMEWLDTLNIKLATADPDYNDTPAKRAINRINNNLMFKPDAPVYKDHFGAGMDLSTNGKQGDFYINLGISENFIASGFYHPKKEHLDSIRQAIDYNGEELVAILNTTSFKNTFGGLIDTGDDLKTAPKGYSQEHEHIELLRKKSFAVMLELKKEEVLKADFMDRCVQWYLDLKPFRNYLNKAVTV